MEFQRGQRVQVTAGECGTRPDGNPVSGSYGTIDHVDGGYHYVHVDGFTPGKDGYDGHEFYYNEIRPSTVSLIASSKVNPSIDLYGIDTIEKLVVYIARVSNPSSQKEGNDPKRLINYLTKHNHWSPFEMVNYTLEINTTRDIARQILRHRSFSFQEFSQRYANINDLSSQMEFREARLQDHKNRQSSHEFKDGDDMLIPSMFHADQERVWNVALEAYNDAIERGIAKEQARVFLPEGLTPSRMYMNGTLRSWIHYVNLRSGNGTQKEHRLIAQDCADAISQAGFPAINDFLEN